MALACSRTPILAVTFTNKAAIEMASRVDALVGARTVTKPLISTFHSFCVRALRRDIETLQIGGKGYRKDFVIYDESDQQNVVKGARCAPRASTTSS